MTSCPLDALTKATWNSGRARWSQSERGLQAHRPVQGWDVMVKIQQPQEAEPGEPPGNDRCNGSTGPVEFQRPCARCLESEGAGCGFLLFCICTVWSWTGSFSFREPPWGLPRGRTVGISYNVCKHSEKLASHYHFYPMPCVEINMVQIEQELQRQFLA